MFDHLSFRVLGMENASRILMRWWNETTSPVHLSTRTSGWNHTGLTELEPASEEPTGVVVMLIKAIMTIGILIGNSMILVAVRHASSYRNYINYWIANLAVSGLMFAFIIIYRYIIDISESHSIYTCKAIMVMLSTTVFVSATCMAVMSYHSFATLGGTGNILSLIMQNKSKTLQSIVLFWSLWLVTSLVATGSMYSKEGEDDKDSHVTCLLAGGMFSKRAVMVGSAIGHLHIINITCLQLGTLVRYRRFMRAVRPGTRDGVQLPLPPTTEPQSPTQTHETVNLNHLPVAITTPGPSQGHTQSSKTEPINQQQQQQQQQQHKQEQLPQQQGVIESDSQGDKSDPSTTKSSVFHVMPQSTGKSPHTSSSSDGSPSQESQNGTSSMLWRELQKKRNERQLRLIRGILVVVVVYIICLSPTAITTALYSLCSYEVCHVDGNTVAVAGLPIGLHFFASVMIIAIRSANYRQAFKQMLKCESMSQ